MLRIPRWPHPIAISRSPLRPLLAVLIACATHPVQAATGLALSSDGLTVYDSPNGVTWLADFDLPASNRFGLPLCTTSGVDPCVNASGAMSYRSALAWIAAMNAANYLGHNNWQIPTTPIFDPGCSFTGPQNNSFGWNCTASALGSLFSHALGLSAPNTAVPLPNLKAGPFTNFQPDLYWTLTSLPQPTGDVGCCATISFNSGWQGSNITANSLFVLPIVPGKIAGTPAAAGTGLQVNPGGQTIYDPIANVTWLANANLARRTRRDCLHLRQRFWSHECASNRGLGLPIRHSLTAPGRPDRWRQSNRPIRRTGSSRPISVQRRDSCHPRQRRSDSKCQLRRRIHTAGRPDCYP